nr:hypothetical protein [Brasilonema bromeliae]
MKPKKVEIVTIKTPPEPSLSGSEGVSPELEQTTESEQTTADVAQEHKDDPEQTTAFAEEEKPEIEEPGAIFQAVGVVTGKVVFTEENKSTIIIGNKEYPLFYAPKKQRAFEALKKEVQATGEATQRLVVYPRFTHFPRRDQPPQVSFQVVGFDKGRETKGAASEELSDMEFKLCGLWQFIPVCPTPCISIFRNFTKERLDHVKKSEPAKKVKFMKASHLPLFWRDAPVPPFRFNPKAEKEQQGKPVFVQIKAKFLPARDAFAFDSLLGLPLEKPPKFLKVSKEDKATALKAKRDAERAAGKDVGGYERKPPYTVRPKGHFSEKPMTEKPMTEKPIIEKPKPKPKPQQQ